MRECKVLALCDNKGLFSRKQKFAERIVNKASYYTQPDHDIIMELEKPADHSSAVEESTNMSKATKMRNDGTKTYHA
jgi:hypothetical protein